MNDVNKLAKALVESAEVRDKKKTSAYDTTARVIKVEGSTAWVAIPGGVDKTPARMAVNAKAGDDVRVRVAGGKAYVMGNTSAPPTDDSLAKAAQDNAIRAAAASEKATASAEAANTAANSAIRDAATAQESADIAQAAANNAVEDAARAHAAADAAQADATIAKDAADTAKESADQALWGLSTVEDVVGTLNWITAHGTMTLTSDTAINPAHVYFVVDAEGDYEVGGVHYSIVTEPKVEELSTYYELTVDESLQNYVGSHLALTGEGLWVLPAASGYKVLIATGQGTTYTEAGTYVIDGNESTVAKFGEVTTLGESGKTRAEIDYHSLQLVDAEGTAYFHVSDLRNESNILEMSETFVADGVNESFAFTLPAKDTNYTVLVDGVEVTPLWKLTIFFTLSTVPAAGTVIVANYETQSELAKAYTAGIRQANKAIGIMSFASGNETAASGTYSHAEGIHTEASGALGAHAEGNYTTAEGTASHAEGGGAKATGGASHAEGNMTVASGYSSHAEGDGAEASGEASHAQNKFTIAASSSQTAIGKFNIKDDVGKHVLIIGNGRSSQARSDALTIDWDGNAHLAIDTTAAAGTTDGDLYAAINALGWTSEVIE